MGRTPRRHEVTDRLAPLVVAAALGVGGVLSWNLVASTASGATSHKPKSFVITTVNNAQFGTILVKGTPVYTLEPSQTKCGALCLQIWPQVLLPKGVTKATAGRGVKASKLGTIRRVHGKLQVTYAGKPLYWFSEDSSNKPSNGNVSDQWGKWSLVVTVKLVSATVPGSPAAGSPAPTSSPSTGTSPPTTSAPSHTTSPPPTSPPPTTQPPPTTTQPPPTTTTTNPGGGGVGF